MKPSELLSGPEKWCWGSYALDKDGMMAYTKSLEACQWCLAGAMLATLSEEEEKLYSDRVREIVKRRGYGSRSGFNDDPRTTFDDVRAVLLEAGL
jgi:hypothetical protein